MNVLQETGHQYLSSTALPPNNSSASSTQPRIMRNSILRRTSPMIIQGSRPSATPSVIPSLQRARNHLAGSIANVEPVSCEVPGNNCSNEKQQPDITGQIRMLGNSVEPRLPVGEVLRRIRTNEQKSAHVDEYLGKPTSASGTSKDEAFFDNAQNMERKLLNHVSLEQKEKKSSVRKEMETALQYNINQNDQDIDDEVSILKNFSRNFYFIFLGIFRSLKTRFLLKI